MVRISRHPIRASSWYVDVLAAISQNPGIHLSGLVDGLLMPLASVCYALNKLEGLAWIKTEKSRIDGVHQRRAKITDTGSQHLARLMSERKKGNPLFTELRP